MADYRAYMIGPDGHFAGSRGFVCDSDEHAIEWARQLLGDQPIELWSGERLIKCLPLICSAGQNAVSHEIHKGQLIPKPAK
jgi:hypothetical protein